jgi:hypothetical protein
MLKAEKKALSEQNAVRSMSEKQLGKEHHAQEYIIEHATGHLIGTTTHPNTGGDNQEVQQEHCMQPASNSQAPSQHQLRQLQQAGLETTMINF